MNPVPPVTRAFKSLFPRINPKNSIYFQSIVKGNCEGIFTPAAESHGLWPWMNAPTFGRDVAPLGRYSGATGFARGALLSSEDKT